MDYSGLLEQYESKTCVISVDTYEDGSYGNILVVTGNKLFKEDIEVFNRRYSSHNRSRSSSNCSLFNNEVI